MADSMRQVDPKYGDCRATNGTTTDQNRAVPPEMSVPLVPARIKKPRTPTGLRINSCEVRAFMMVVGKTCEREVAGDRLASVLSSNNMIDLEREFVVDLRHAAIFTAAVSTLPDQRRKTDVHTGSSAPAGSLKHLTSFRFESGQNRANALEVVHLRVFFGSERPSAGLGRQLMHPANFLLGKNEFEDGPGRKWR